MRVNRDKEAVLSPDHLRSIMRYDPRSGLFTRTKTTRGGSGVAGRVVGSPHHGGYLYVWIGKFQYLIHRLAWLWMTGEWPPNQIDHINRDKSDNRWSNLRLATHGQNRHNSRRNKNNTSGHKGVSFVSATGKWHSHLRVNGTRFNLGFFASPVAAAACTATHAAYLVGDFARLGDHPEWNHD